LTLQLSSQRALVLCINICVDIGTRILSFNENANPKTYSEIFESLGKIGIVDKEIKDNIIGMVKLRNVLDHLHMDINNDQIYEISFNII